MLGRAQGDHHRGRHQDPRQENHPDPAAHGIQHVRTHVDVTDPQLTALKAMLEVREESRHLIDLQIVAFPRKASSRTATVAS